MTLHQPDVHLEVQDPADINLSNLNRVSLEPISKHSSITEIKLRSRIYHENSHLKSSPRSPHGRDEGPAVLFGVVTLHSP